MFQSNNKAEPRFAMFFSKLQMVVLNDFVLFLKQESSSSAQGLKAQYGCRNGAKFNVLKFYSYSTFIYSYSPIIH